jgi:hypothetical protein
MSDGSSLGYLFTRFVRNLALGLAVWLIPVTGFVGGACFCSWIVPVPSRGSDGERGVMFVADLPLYALYALAGILGAAAGLTGFNARRTVRDAFFDRANADDEIWYEDTGSV